MSSIYHLVMTNSSPWKDSPFLIGKPSISIRAIYTMVTEGMSSQLTHFLWHTIWVKTLVPATRSHSCWFPQSGGFHGYGDAPIGGYWMTTGGTPYDLGNHQATSLPDFHSHLQPSLLASPAPWGPTSEKSPNQNHSWLNNDHEIIYNNVLSKSTWMYIHHEDIR